MPERRANRIAIAVVAAIMLALVVPPLVNANRFRGRVAGAISNAIGRKTTVGNVSLRLLPQPGFQLKNLVIEDDPAFSAEPMLRAEDVTAALRLASLWRGRFEIASLSLKYPSLNLVRGQNGEWNLEALLTRATQTPAAPTGKRTPEARPRFPYIEAEGGRINLKIGQEKKVYSFSEADFALWLAPENEWRMRLEARPIRTDANLSDTGVVQVSGSFQRAASLRDIALRFDFEWDNAQLGNLSQLVYGRDRGWRGGLDVTGSVAGTPGELLLSARATFREFRRYDIVSADAMNLDIGCTAKYLGDTAALTDLLCRLPAGNGEFIVRGTVTRPFGEMEWAISIAGTAVPMSEVARFARHAKKDMPEDLSATGQADAAFTFRTLTPGGAPVWSGGGSTSAFRLTAAALSPPLEIGPLRFALVSPAATMFKPRAVIRPRSPFLPGGKNTAVSETRLTIETFPVSLGGVVPATARATVDRDRYDVYVQGEADVQRLVAVGNALGLRPPRVSANGTAQVDIIVSGSWAGFRPPAIRGGMQLRNVTASIKGLNAPLQLNNARLWFLEDGLRVTDVSASFAGSPLLLQGSLNLPRGCTTLPDCPAHFNLHAPVLNADDLNRLLNPAFENKPWYRFATGSSEKPGLLRLQAEGQLTAGRLVIKPVAVNRAGAHVRFANGKLELKELTGEVFGGRHRGVWSADFTGNTPLYQGSGAVERVSLAEISSVMRDNWGAGTMQGSYQFSLAGETAAEMALSAAGRSDFEWRQGLLRRITLRGGQPLRVRRFTGTAALANGRISIAEGRMETADGIYAVSGSATFGRELDFKLVSGERVYAVTGTLARPRVASPPPTEAVLKQ